MSTKLSPGTWFAPFYGWTKGDYERALQRDVVAPAPVVAPTRGPVAAFVEAVGPTLPWKADALCREHPELDWFDDRHQDAAKDVCSRCLVRVECFEAGAAGREIGVWGATTAKERSRLRRAKVA